jgi:hypothetical protein
MGVSRGTDRMLLQLADALFGPIEKVRASDHSWRPPYLGVAALLAIIVVARRPDMVTNPQFWAEDGCLFFLENSVLGFPRALASFYKGFPYLLPRLIAFAGGLVPTTHAPRVYTASALALTALALASFSLPAFRSVIRSDWLRVLFAAAVVTLPMRYEVLGTPTNLGWFVAVWLSLVALIRLPQRSWQVTLLGAGSAVAVWSTPLAVINLPLWVLRAYRGVRRHAWREVGFAATLVVSVIALYLLSDRLGAPSRVAFDLARVFRISAWLLATLVLPAEMAARHAGSLPLLALAGVMLVAPLAASRAARWRNLPLQLLSLALAFMAVGATVAGRPLQTIQFPPHAGARFWVYPASQLSLAYLIALEGLPQRALKATAGALLAGLVLWARLPAFVLGPFADERWAVWAPRVERALNEQCPVELRVPMNPNVIPFIIAWGPTLPASPVRPESIVASLGPTGTFRQPFVSLCERLSSVELSLAAPPSRQGDLLFSLLDGPRVVAAVRIPRDEVIERGWQPLCFAPIAGSEGRRFVAVLKTVMNDPAASVMVLGTAQDPGADRRAWVGGRTLEAEASLRYGCRTSEPRGCLREQVP